MPPPFTVRSQGDPGRDLGTWDESGNVSVPGRLTVAGGVTLAGSDLAGQLSSIQATSGPALKSGRYYFTTSQNSAGTSGTLGNNTLRLTAWFVTRTITIDRIGAEVTIIGDVGSKLRLGIYADDGSGYPGALLLDAGQIAGDSATAQEITVSQTLQPGLYWIGGAVQAAATTQPTVRTVISSWLPPVMLIFGTSIPAAGATSVGHSQGSISGALPANFTTSANTIGAVPRVFIRAA